MTWSCCKTRPFVWSYIGVSWLEKLKRHRSSLSLDLLYLEINLLYEMLIKGTIEFLGSKFRDVILGGLLYSDILKPLVMLVDAKNS